MLVGTSAAADAGGSSTIPNMSRLSLAPATRALKIRDRQGCKGGIGDLFPVKPKGMHQFPRSIRPLIELRREGQATCEWAIRASGMSASRSGRHAREK